MAAVLPGPGFPRLLLRFARAARALLPVLLVASLLLSGCGKESTAPAPALGLLEGWIDGGDGPVLALVRAVPVGATGSPAYEAAADSAGHYVLSLPQGDYNVSVEHEGLRFFFTRLAVTQTAPGDTVRISAEPRRADFLFGAMVLDLTSVPALDGRTVTMRAESGSADDPILSPAVTRVISGGQAVFDFPWLPQGIYRVRAEVAGARPFWLYAADDREHAVTIPLAHGRTARPHAFLDAPGLVVGRILGSWQEMGAARPRITVFRSVSDIVDTIEAQADGRFRMETFVTGSFRFRVDIEGFSRWWGGSSYETATAASAAPGESVSLPDYRESGILLSLSGPAGAPAGPARIELSNAEGLPVTPSDFVWSSDGPVRLPNLPPGEYRIRVEPAYAGAAWCPRAYGAAHVDEAGTPIVLAGEGETARIAMDLFAEGSLSGTISAAEADVPVRVFLQTEDGREVARVLCDPATGLFSLTCVPPGAYRIAAAGWLEVDADATWYPGTRSRAEASVLTVGPSGVINGLDWILIRTLP